MDLEGALEFNCSLRSDWLEADFGHDGFWLFLTSFGHDKHDTTHLLHGIFEALLVSYFALAFFYGCGLYCDLHIWLALGKVVGWRSLLVLVWVFLCLEIMELLYINIETVGLLGKHTLPEEWDHTFLTSYW